MNREDILHEMYLKSWIDPRGRRVYYDGKGKKRVKFSRFVWNLYHPNDLIKSGDGYVIHHEDENTLNDHPYNLKKKLRGKHIAKHNKGNKLTEEHRENIKKNHARYWAGKTQSKEHIEKKVKAQIGKKRTEKAKRRMVEAWKVRDKISVY